MNIAEKLITTINSTPISSGQWFKPKRKGDTAVGELCEEILGIKENNSQSCDLPYGLEVKACRDHTSSMTTLATAAPKPIQGRGLIKRLVNDHGTVVDGELRLYRTLTAGKSSEGLWVARDGSELIICDDSGIRGRWSAQRLQTVVSKKIKNVVLFKAETQTVGKSEQFRYRQATLMLDASAERFLDAIENGFIKIDLRAKIGANGKCRDHGTAFRLPERHYGKLFETVDVVWTSNE